MNFYFVHHGGPLALTLQASAAADYPATRQAGGADTGTREDPKILYRFFDHHENLVEWGYHRLAPGSVTEWEHDFGKQVAPGIYQIRYAGQGLTTDAWATPTKAFGLAPSRCQISVATEGQFESLWFSVPPGCGPFAVSAIGRSGRITDQQGEPVAEFSHGQKASVDGETWQGQQGGVRASFSPPGAMARNAWPCRCFPSSLRERARRVG